MKPYTLTVEIARSESASNPFDVCFSDQEYLLRREDGYLSARLSWGSQLQEDLAELHQPSPDRGIVQRLGDTLRAFLGQLGWEAHEARLMDALRGGQQVHITFRFAAAELYTLPWELVTLKSSGQHLGELPGCHLHYEWPGAMAPAAPDVSKAEGGRILFAWSAAGGVVPAEEHLRALREACARNGYTFEPARDVISNVSLHSLATALEASPEPVAALHILCHGSRSPSQEYGLMWNAAEGQKAVFVDAGDLRQTLAPHAGSLRMVVLCACQSGNAAPNSHLGSMAQALHRVGIPAVVSSRMPLTARGSILLTETLYEELLGRLSPLNQALAVARGRLKEDAEHLDWASLQLYAHSEDALAPRPFRFRPYRGLRAFGPEDRRFFFGRKRLEEELRARIRHAAQGQRPRFQVVAGASGVGKSSAVMAGLVAMLPRQEWDWLVVRPGELVRGSTGSPGARSSALRELRQRVHQLWATGPLPANGGASLDEVVEEVRQLRRAHPGRRLLLVVDQFEEVLTLLEREECQALVRGVWALAQQPELESVVVATLRVEFFARCEGVMVEDGRRLDSVIYDGTHQFFVGQMGLEELVEAIEQPARKVGMELEAGLVDRLRQDVGHEPGALPLLEHALDLLWQRREGRWLTHRSYDEMGGVTGALTQMADQLYEELGEAERRQVRRLLVRLVAARDMGRPRSEGRLWVEGVRPREGAGRGAFEAALEKLVRSRLLVQGGSMEGALGGRGAWVQPAHETLLRRWKKLEQWVEEDWEREKQLREIEAWAEGWAEHQGCVDGGSSHLLRGERLRHAQCVQEKHGDELSQRSHRLIEVSLAEEEHRRRAEMETKQVLARAQAGTRRGWLRRIIARPCRPQAGGTVVLRGHIGQVLSATFSPDGARVVTLSADRTARVWSAHGELLATLRGLNGAAVRFAEFSPDGERVVTASEGGTAQVWSMRGDLLGTLIGHEGELHSAHFSPDGERVVTASEDGTARVWSAYGEPLRALAGHEGAVFSAHFSPDGERVVTASADGTARLWHIGATASAEHLADVA